MHTVIGEPVGVPVRFAGTELWMEAMDATSQFQLIGETATSYSAARVDRRAWPYCEYMELNSKKGESAILARQLAGLSDEKNKSEDNGGASNSEFSASSSSDEKNKSEDNGGTSNSEDSNSDDESTPAAHASASGIGKAAAAKPSVTSGCKQPISSAGRTFLSS